MTLAEIAITDPLEEGGDGGQTESLAAEDVAPTVPEDPRFVTINQYFAAKPEMVLGAHALRRGIYGPGLTYTCRAQADRGPLEAQFDAALSRLPASHLHPRR